MEQFSHPDAAGRKPLDLLYTAGKDRFLVQSMVRQVSADGHVGRIRDYFCSVYSPFYPPVQADLEKQGLIARDRLGRGKSYAPACPSSRLHEPNISKHSFIQTPTPTRPRRCPGKFLPGVL